MRAVNLLTLAAVTALSGLLSAQPADKNGPAPASGKERLIGAWHLVSMVEPGPDGKMARITDRKGMLIYTRDGHMSVQLMYPPAQAPLSNDYVLKGYEASFGSYDVNEKTHTVTHHVQGSITRGLVGKDLPRAFQFAGRLLILHSTRPEEHWFVTWEHD